MGPEVFERGYQCLEWTSGGDDKGEEGSPHPEGSWEKIRGLESLLGSRKGIGASNGCLQSQEVVKRLRGSLGSAWSCQE